MMNAVVAIEPVRSELFLPVGELMAYGFGYKFNKLTSLSFHELAHVFEQLLHYLPQQQNSIRVVARQQDEVVGTMCLKWKGEQPTYDLSWWNKCNGIGNWKLFKLVTGLTLLHHSPNLQECYIEDLVVHPQHQGKGIGKLLLQYANQFMMQSASLSYLSLHVASHNDKAIKLYERYQFNQLNDDSSLLTGLLLGEKKWNYMIREGERYA